jgi:hypothetical protein
MTAAFLATEPRQASGIDRASLILAFAMASSGSTWPRWRCAEGSTSRRWRVLRVESVRRRGWVGSRLDHALVAAAEHGGTAHDAAPDFSGSSGGRGA